jgi:hypothetical protein
MKFTTTFFVSLCLSAYAVEEAALGDSTSSDDIPRRLQAAATWEPGNFSKGTKVEV